MQKCVELHKLHKPAHGLKSINFKRTTPGGVHNVAHANKPPSKQRVLDPTHPALKLTPSEFGKAFPWRTYPGFAIRAVPKALLERPANPFPDPPFPPAPVYSKDDDRAKDGRGRVSMSLLNVASKSAGGRVLRVNVLNKFKTAISLIVTRGADAERGEGEQRIVFKPERLGGEWVLSDWTYICRPEPELNRMSYATLISSLRCALHDIVVRGNELEQRWAAELARQKRSTTQPKDTTKLQATDDQVAPLPVLTEPLCPKPSTIPAPSPASPSPYKLPRPSSPSSPASRPRILNSSQLLRTSNNQASFALNAMMQRLKDGLLASQGAPHTPRPPTKLGVPLRTKA
ncbi:hypothetical protein C8Q74DRAFT_951049 [Fomes fomentarius]|nr:hypothetical protein C8Q74DRAFT_951049 [Fomes fomentarius]